ncbi:hypothetical protein BJY04DRAFT_184630 [Aspergillus karnatakaensis]|uniref:uncharacterized protein n=1 Tax=Aspergillus karnatakaensis TaxID=1810916 RepID=UPI003CCCE305
MPFECRQRATALAGIYHHISNSPFNSAFMACSTSLPLRFQTMHPPPLKSILRAGPSTSAQTTRLERLLNRHLSASSLGDTL